MRNRPVLVIPFLIALLCATTLAAQTFHGGIRGEVRDVNGVVPGVTVTLTNEQTNITRERS